MCDEKNMCCLQGPQGVPGMQGSQGIQGVPGPQGVPGMQGSQGVQGIQGVAGPAGTGGGSSCDGYANVFASIAQVIGAHSTPNDTVLYANVFASIAQVIGAYSTPNDTVLFDQQNAVSTGDFDLTQANVTGDIKFLKHGIYHVQWQLQARITAPAPNPVPSWSFGFWINGVLVPGSIYSGFTQAPGDDACHSTGDVIIEVMPNALLRLRNTSVSSVNLNPNVTGSVFPITIASVNIECLTALP